MESASELVWLYVKQRPFLKEMMRQGIVNYSALARKVSADAFGGRASQNALKMALIRLGAKIGAQEADLEGKILSLLKKSSMAVRSKVAVVISKKDIEGLRFLSQANSGRNVTYIVEERELEKIPRKSLWKVEENLNLVVIESPEELEETPGVIAHILGALASEGVNVVEFISCYTDTLLVLRQSDTQKAYRILSHLMS